MLLRGFRLFGVARHREPKGTKRSMAVVWEELAFLGDTRSRHELLVFAQANQSRLPLAMGIVQPHIPARRMASEHKTKLTDALVSILSRFLTPATISMDGAHDSYYRETSSL